MSIDMSKRADAELLKTDEVIKYKVDENLNGELVDQLSELKHNELYLYWNLETIKDNSKKVGLQKILRVSTLIPRRPLAKN